MSHPLVRTAAAVFGALALTLAALAGTSTANAQSVTVRITHTLDPASVTVAPGTAITFENADGERHRMRTTSGPSEFDSGNLDPGQSFTVTLSAIGTYRYLDERDDENPAYVGTIVVSASAPTTTPGAPPTTDPSAPSEVTVSMANRVFTPAVVTVAAGGTVTWVNDDDRPHTVTADDRSFDSGLMDPGATWSLTLPTGGTFTYFCELHPDMRGSISVVGGSDPPPTTTPPTTPPTTTPPTTSPGAPAPSAASVAIVGNQFSPSTITIVAGGTVTWVSEDSVPHTVTALDGSFDSGLLRQSDTWSRTFASAGSYPYYCELHPEMTGTVVVLAPGSADPPTTAPTPPASPTSPPATAPPSPSPTPPTTTPAPASSGSPAPMSASVRIVDNSYAPAVVTIAVGGTVTWSNDDSLPHTVTALDRSFDSGIMFDGDSWSMTFPAAGSYPYFCELHPEMTGTVLVLAPGDSPPTPAATPRPAATTPAGVPSAPAASVAPSSTSHAGSGQVVAGGTTASGPVAPSDVSVTMGDNRFEPVAVTVAAGGRVTWTNTDSIPHTVTADGRFDSGIMMPGDTFTQRFDEVGSVAYRCILHPGMDGTVEVDASGDGAGDTGGVPVTGSSGAEPTSVVSPSEPEAPAEPGDVDEVVVRITESEFPTVVTIAAGQTIAWVNDDDRAVDVVADDGSFESGEIAPGERFAWTFPLAGAVSYRSELRDQMAGMIVVVDGSVDEVEILPTVAVFDAWFAPRELVVHQGDTVRFAFGGVLPHTVTAADGSFDSGILEPGAVFTFRFDELGTYSYSCLLHPAMVATVTVVPPDEEIPASRSGISTFDTGSSSEAEVAPPTASSRAEPSDGAGAMVLLGLGLMIGLAVGVLYGVGKVAVRRPTPAPAN